MRLTRMLLITALAAVLMALGGCGDGDDSGAEDDGGGFGVGEDAGDGDNASDALGGEAGGSGTLTLDGEMYEFDSVFCGRSAAGDEEVVNFNAISGDLSLSTTGFDTGRQVVIVVGGEQYIAGTDAIQDGELTVDESGASGDLEFAAAAGGDSRQGSFEVTCDGQ